MPEKQNTLLMLPYWSVAWGGVGWTFNIHVTCSNTFLMLLVLTYPTNFQHAVEVKGRHLLNLIKAFVRYFSILQTLKS